MAMHRPGHRVLLAGLALLVTGGAIAVVLATTGSDGDVGAAPQRSQSARLKHFIHARQQHPKRPPGEKACQKDDPEGHTNPAKILGENAAGTTTSILLPVNVWTAGDCHQVTEVEAGAAGWHASAGIFVIGRTQGSHSSGGPLYIVVPGSGATRITHAPIGSKVVSWAQRRGELDFTSKRGFTGTVHLSDDTVTLSTGAVIQATDRPFSGAG
jgi:hypothetical protein